MTHASKISVETVPLHHRGFQQQHIRSVHKYGMPIRRKQIILTAESLENLQWWTSPKPVQENSTPIVEPVSNITIQTDASCLGWGAVCQGTKTGGHWNKEEQQAHINILELKAAYLAIQSYLKACQLTESRILLQMDNTTAVAYINKRGGTKSNKLTQLALDIWNICQSKKITLIAQHLPGIRNTEAGAESRHINNRIEWTLDKQLFANIQKCYYKPQVDIFASRLNHQLPLYLARRPDPGAMAVDAFTMDWSQWTSFIYTLQLYS